MRILYDNLLESATLAATNEDANYPVENIHNNSLKIRFQADTNSTVITATLASASTVSTFAFGNHNISTVAVQLTDSVAATTTYNYTASDLQFSSDNKKAIIYETAVSDIVEIEYTITSAVATYVGGLYAGQYLQMPEFAINPKIGKKSTGSTQKSRGGVAFDVPGVTLETFSCTFDNGSITDLNAQQAWFAAVQTYKPTWYDRWESDDPQIFPPLFAQNTNDVSWIKGQEGLIFDSFRLDLEECK